MAVIGNESAELGFGRSIMATDKTWRAIVFIEYDVVMLTVTGWPATTVLGATTFVILASAYETETALGTNVKATNATIRKVSNFLSCILTKRHCHVVR